MSIVLSPHNSVESTGNTSNDIIGGSTTLNGSISDSTTTLIVTSTIQFPTNGTIDIEGEYIIYTGTTSTTFTGCISGSFNSVAVTLEVFNSVAVKPAVFYSATSIFAVINAGASKPPDFN